MERMSEKSVEYAGEVHLAEYNAVRDEIRQQIDIQNSFVNYAIAIIGVAATFLATGNPSVGSQFPFLYLISSILLSAISWGFIESSIWTNDLSTYVKDNLAPKIQKIIGNERANHYQVLQWENARNKRRERVILRGLTMSGRFSIPIIGSILFLIAFYYIKSSTIQAWTTFEWLLFIFSALLITFTLISGAINILSSYGKGKK